MVETDRSSDFVGVYGKCSKETSRHDEKNVILSYNSESRSQGSELHTKKVIGDENLLYSKKLEFRIFPVSVLCKIRVN